MQSFVRSKLGSSFQRINTFCEKHIVRHKSLKESVAKIVPKKPKKPRTVQERFLETVESQIRAENPNYSLQEMKTIAKEMWRDLGREAKAPFVTAVRQETEAYNEAYQLYACGLSDEESAARLLKEERRVRSKKLRSFRDRLTETGKPRKPIPAFGIFAAEMKAMGGCDGPTGMGYHEKLRLKWKELPEEEKEKYKQEYRKKMEDHNEQLAVWANDIIVPFSKWIDIQAIASSQKSMTDFGRPRKPPTALTLFIDKMKSEKNCETNFDMKDCLLRWSELKKEEKQVYIAEAQKLYDDYEKKSDEWNKKMNESLGSWANKIKPEECS